MIFALIYYKTKKLLYIITLLSINKEFEMFGRAIYKNSEFKSIKCKCKMDQNK